MMITKMEYGKDLDLNNGSYEYAVGEGPADNWLAVY